MCDGGEVLPGFLKSMVRAEKAAVYFTYFVGVFLFLPLIPSVNELVRVSLPSLYGVWIYLVELRGGVRFGLVCLIAVISIFSLFCRKLFAKHFCETGFFPSVQDFRVMVERGLGPVQISTFLVVRLAVATVSGILMGFFVVALIWNSIK